MRLIHKLKLLHLPQGTSYFFYQQPEYPRDCKEVRDSCNTKHVSGVFQIKPDGYHKPFEVYCDNEDDGGGWTVRTLTTKLFHKSQIFIFKMEQRTCKLLHEGVSKVS